MTEGLFDDHARPVMVVFLREQQPPKLLDDGGKEAWRDREVEEFVALGAVELVSFVDCLCQAFIGFRVLKVAFDVVDALLEPVPKFQIDLGRSVLGNLFGKELRKLSVVRSLLRSQRWQIVRRGGHRSPRLQSAGISLRLVRSPVAPKITMTQGERCGVGA